MEYLVKDTGSCGALRIISTDNQNSLSSVRDIIRDAAENGADTIAIFELGGIAGFPAAHYAIERVRRATAGMRLVYGTWIGTLTGSLAGSTCGSAILIPRNQQGVTTLYRLLTKAFFELAEKPLNERLSLCSTALPLIHMEDVEANSEDIFCVKIPLENSVAADIGELSRMIDLDELTTATEEVRAFPKGTFLPEIDGGIAAFSEICYAKAHEIYGDPLPEAVEARLSAELGAIAGNGYLPIFAIAKIMTDKAHEDGVKIGYRGMVGGSLAAMLSGITEIDPLPPHYSCSRCGTYIEANIKAGSAGSEAGNAGSEAGSAEKKDIAAMPSAMADASAVIETPWELPERRCPHCGAFMKKDGYGIPAEVFFGLRYDREPDIDLNVPPEYNPVLKNKLEEVFGEGYVIRGGSGRPGFVHPGALLIVPKGLDPQMFTPLQRAGNSKKGEIVTHFPAYLLDYPLVKIDVLSHNNFSLLARLAEKTGVDPSSIPLNDKKMWEMFTSDTETDDITDDITEFGTGFAKHILQLIHPHSVAELIRVSALMHGTGVWNQNAEELIESGTAGIMDIVSCRDDIFNYLIRVGLDRNTAYSIMDRVRKHRPITNAQLAELENHNVPDWYIESLTKIQYVFPRSHAVIYTITSLRILWYKAHYPETFAEAAAWYKENYPSNNYATTDD